MGSGLYNDTGALFAERIGLLRVKAHQQVVIVFPVRYIFLWAQSGKGQVSTVECWCYKEVFMYVP